MPNAAIVAAALTDHAARAYALYVAGLDTINDSTVRTPVDSIHIVENGPGGVSTMDFEIWDSTAALTLTNDIPVAFWDLTNDVCLFRGWVDGWSSSPMAAGGRVYTIGCIGVEAILDWVYAPSISFIGYYPTLMLMVATLIGQNAPMVRSYGVNFLGDPGAPFTRSGNFNYPTGFMSDGTGGMDIATPTTSTTLSAGTLRQVIDAMILVCIRNVRPIVHVTVLYTIDFYMGLRMWENDIAFQPDDYTTLTVTDTVAGAMAATRLTYNVEPGDVVHEVYVAGGNAAGSGLFGDGTGIRRKQDVIQDSAIVTADDAANQAENYLAAQTQGVRGTFTLENIDPASVATVHAGSLLALTDTPSGATGTYRIFSIAKTFHGIGQQDWEVSFGGLKPSATRLVRRLTRNTFS